MLALAVAVGIWAVREADAPTPTPPATRTIDQPNAVLSATPAKSAPERLADAFEAATWHRHAFSQTEAGEVITTKPVRIIELPFGPALLTIREIKDGCHGCEGAIGVYYLDEAAKGTRVTARWPKAVGGWGWGAPPPEWYLTDKFTAYPAIYASGGYTGQGITVESATITELQPNGPVTSDVIWTGYSDEGNIVDGEREACVLEGKFSKIQKNRSFDVVVSGAIRGVDRYLKKGGKFLRSSKIDWDIPCGM